MVRKASTNDKAGTKGNLMLPIVYTYMDPNNNKYTIEKDIELRLFSTEETEKYGNGTDDSKALYWIIGVVAVILLFIAWRVHRRYKKH